MHNGTDAADLNALPARACTAARWLESKGIDRPVGLVVLGSGWSPLAEAVDGRFSWHFGTIPGMPDTATAGHPGILIAGLWMDVPCVVLAGRWHGYEGIDAEATVLPGSLAAALNCRWLLSTNAVGGIDQALQVGQLVSISDDIAFGCGPVLPRVPRRSEARLATYSPRLRAAFRNAARAQSVKWTDEVLALMLGPSYETPAEIEMLRVMGAGVVGMSTVPESRFARLLGLDTAALSCVTNLVPSRPSAPLSHGDVLAVLKNSGQTALRMIEAWLRDPFVRNPF